MMVIAASIKYRSLIGVWATCSVNTKEWIIKFDFRGERGQSTLGKVQHLKELLKAWQEYTIGGVGQVLWEGRGPWLKVE